MNGWTTERVARLHDLRNAGATIASIAETLDVSVAAAKAAVAKYVRGVMYEDKRPGPLKGHTAPRRLRPSSAIVTDLASDREAYKNAAASCDALRRATLAMIRRRAEAADIQAEVARPAMKGARLRFGPRVAAVKLAVIVLHGDASGRLVA